MLLGRTSECGRIDRLLERARGGESGVLVVRGDPGIGKTALLRYAREQAMGMNVAETRGVESEAELPFAALSELLEPLLEGLPRVPEPQAAALQSALALGPPVPGDAFAVAAGTLRLISEAAQAAPLLLVVDDAHWLDAGSAQTLLFAARRLGADGVAVLAAVRQGEPSLFDGGGFPELPVEGLSAELSIELLAATSAVHRPVAAVLHRLVEAAAGNPLALRELPALLDEEQLSGKAALPDPLPVGPGLRHAFELRLSALPARTREALVVAAAGESTPLSAVLRALAARGLEPATLEPGERARLVTLSDGRLEWLHPLLRSTTYYGASTFERAAAHAALGHVLSGVERAWHLAAAAVGPDERVARELEEAALNARLRRGHVAAARAFERAAELSPGADDSARRHLEAARDFHLAGRAERARELARRALVFADDPVLRAELEHLLGVADMWGADAAAAHELLLAAADAIEHVDPGRAAAILADAALACQISGDVARTLELARRAHDLAPSAVDTEPLLLNTLILAGHATEARPALLRLIGSGVAAVSSRDPVFFAATAGHSLIWIGEHAAARGLFTRELQAARRSGSLALMPFLLACLSELELRVGRWQASYANAAESIRIADETDQRNVLGFALATLARVEAATGLEQDCRRHAVLALELGEELGAGSIRAYALAALGLLELGLGRTREALASLVPLATLIEEQGLREPGVIQWAPDLIEALVLSGRRDHARAALSRFESDAVSAGNDWALAAVSRARGMLLGAGFELEFEAALRGRSSPFERARTELRLGERLRRERRPTEARGPLRSARETFEALGARGWAAQAGAELVAAGERPRGGRTGLPALLRELTEQERRIAFVVAEGATNREAAASLFLSPKTIGYHLGKVYEKLGVRSRTELARILAGATVQPLDEGTHAPARA